MLAIKWSQTFSLTITLGLQEQCGIFAQIIKKTGKTHL